MGSRITGEREREKLLLNFSLLYISVCDQCQGGACRLIAKEQGRPAEMQCCHEECAGGCSGNQSNQCDVCKHVIHNKECRSVCPPGLYLVSTSFHLFHGRRLSLLLASFCATKNGPKFVWVCPWDTCTDGAPSSAYDGSPIR